MAGCNAGASGDGFWSCGATSGVAELVDALIFVEDVGIVEGMGFDFVWVGAVIGWAVLPAATLAAGTRRSKVEDEVSCFNVEFVCVAVEDPRGGLILILLETRLLLEYSGRL